VLYRKTVQQTVDDDILTKQHSSRVHREERKERETGLVALGAKKNDSVREGTFDSCNEGLPQNQTRRSPQVLDSYLCTVFLHV
jgi:hypothetical protein